MLVEKVLFALVGSRDGSQIESTFEDGTGFEELVVECRFEAVDEGTRRLDASRVEADDVVAACRSEDSASN